MMLSCVLLAVMTKSAQFPFHIWLPDTMQTPTPVSAIMHAGVINAGGFLLARLSAGLMLSSNLLMLIAIIGLTTLLIGNLFTIMQPDIKKKLAYSTMSQMGYMVLQCGLGCFTGAIYHLIVHGFFKAWSFLNSGNQLSVVEKKEHPSAPFYFWLIILTMSAGTFCLIKKELLSIVLAYPLLAVFMIITLVQFSIASWGNTASINQKLISFAITLTITTLYLMIIAPAAHEHFGTVNFSFQILAGTMILSCLGMYYLLPLNPKILYRFCYLIHNKLFIEEWYRETLLTPIREIGDQLNRLLSIHRFLLISLGTTILVAIFFSHDFNAIKISFTAVFLCLTLIVFLLAANRGHRLIDIAIYFILSQYTISAIAFLFSSNHGREIAYYQIVNASVVSLLMLYTLYKIKKANNIKTLALSHNENKLPWLSFYTTISLFLMIGLPRHMRQKKLKS